MSRNFCTLFDRNYLYQGVALHRSLVRHAADFKLYALCMDSESYELLSRMELQTLAPIRLDELLTAEAQQVRARTTHGQFCWVCQPLICQYLLDRFELDMVTYLESDSLFFSSPEPLFEELGSRSVSLVPHNFSAEFDNSATAGKYCVQFNAFRNDAAARAVLADWRQACFRYDKSAPDTYPGQTCLDTWQARFAGVGVLENRGAGVAPWNIRGYRLDCAGGSPVVDGVPVVFYHYHQYGRLAGGAHELGSYPMTQQVVQCFYRPYVDELRAAERSVRAADPRFAYRREYPRARSARDLLGVLKRKLRGRYNVYPDSFFSATDQSP